MENYSDHSNSSIDIGITFPVDNDENEVDIQNMSYHERRDYEFARSLQRQENIQRRENLFFHADTILRSMLRNMNNQSIGITSPSLPQQNQLISIVRRIPSFEDVSVVLDQNQLNQLYTKKIKNINKKNKKCLICLQLYNEGDIVIFLKCCNYYYHKNCIEKWLKDYNYKCPLCRKPVGKGHPKI